MIEGPDRLLPADSLTTSQQDGAVKLMAGLKIPGMTAPFSGSASVQDMEVNPEINTRVQDVGVDFGFQVIESDLLYFHGSEKCIQFPI